MKWALSLSLSCQAKEATLKFVWKRLGCSSSLFVTVVCFLSYILAFRVSANKKRVIGRCESDVQIARLGRAVFSLGVSDQGICSKACYVATGDYGGSPRIGTNSHILFKEKENTQEKNITEKCEEWKQTQCVRNSRGSQSSSEVWKPLHERQDLAKPRCSVAAIHRLLLRSCREGRANIRGLTKITVL